MSEKANSTKRKHDPIESIGKNLKNILKVYAHEISTNLPPFLFRYRNTEDEIVVITFSLRKNELAIEKNTLKKGARKPFTDKFCVLKQEFFDQYPNKSKKKIASKLGQNRCRPVDSQKFTKTKKMGRKRTRIEKIRGRNNQTRTTRQGCRAGC